MRQFSLMVAMLVSCGCTLNSEQSATNPEKAVRDDRLLGTWIYKDEGAPAYYTITAAGEDYPSGVCILKDSSDPDDLGWFVTEKIGEVSYISMGTLADWNTSKDMIDIAPYKFVDGKLRIYEADEDKIKQLIQAGKITGKADQASSKVTANRMELRNFLANYHSTIFSDTRFFELSKK